MKIPAHVDYVIKKLHKHNYLAYLVGGCVRDFVLNRDIRDFDLVTDASLRDIYSIFDRIVPTGERFGTVLVVTKDGVVELSQMKGNLEQDCSRRDFTINSMAMDTRGVIYDFYGGQGDIKSKILRAVQDPDQRFIEDPLRLLRLIRFAVELNYKICKQTTASAVASAYLIKKVAVERIRDEFCRILITENPAYGIELMVKHRLVEFIIPEIIECIGFEQHSPHHDKDVFRHIMEVLNNSPPRLNVRLASLFHDIGKPKTFTLGKDGKGHFYNHHIVGAAMTMDILKRLKFDNKTIDNVTILVREHMSRFEFLREKNIKKFIIRVGINNLEDLFDLQIADIKGRGSVQDISRVSDLRSKVNDVLIKNEALMIKDLAVNGKDLAKLGIKPGPQMGAVLNSLLDAVLENKANNEKTELLSLAQKIIG